MEHLTWHTTSGDSALRAPRELSAEVSLPNMPRQKSRHHTIPTQQMETYDANL